MIELKGISKIYQMGEKEFYALKNVDLRIEKGDFVAVRGASGSGKTTLLNIIGCLDSYTEGTYLLEGQEIGQLNDARKAEIRNSRIGFVLQDFALINTETVYYNVALPLMFSKIPFGQIRKKVREALETVGLLNQEKKLANQLSGGQRQRVAIARALVNDPAVILADEPTGQLDSRTGRQIMELLTDLNRQGRTVVVVTHDAQVASFCPRQLWVKDGWVTELQSGTPSIPETTLDLPEEPETPEGEEQAKQEAFEAFAMAQGQQRLRKRWIKITAVMLAITFLFGFQIFASTTTWLTAEEAEVKAELLPTGDIKISYNDKMTGHYGSDRFYVFGSQRYRTWFTSGDDRNYWIDTGGYIDDRFIPASTHNYWYLDPQDGTPEVLLWDGGEPMPDMEKNYMTTFGGENTALGSICTYSGIGAAVLILLGFLLRKNIFGRGLIHTGAFCASLAAAILLATNGRFMMNHIVAFGWIMSILLMTPMFFGAYLCCVKLYRVGVAAPVK